LPFYLDLTITNWDFLRLESFSCVKWDPIVSRDLKKLFAYPKESGFTFDCATFSATDVGKTIVQLSETGLKHAIPTTVGQLIGIYVSDMLTSTTTSLEGWWTET
jgi:hypothetical protein